MDKLESMRIFVQVVESRSFTAAADVLQTHRPAVTKAVQELEREAGARLLNRTTRKVTLTTDGEDFYKHSVQIIESVAVAFGLSTKATARPKGTLRIELPVSLANRLVIPALPDFKRLFPDIDIVISVGDMPVDIVGEGLDCALRLGPLGDLNVVARTIGMLQIVTCAAPGYLARFGTPRTLQDLDAHVAVNYFSGRNRKVMDWSFVVDDVVTSFRMKSGIEVNETEAFVASGVAGLGLIQCPQINVQSYLESGALVSVLANIKSPPRAVSILYASRKHNSPRVRAFADWLARLFEAKGLA